jgi:hypothetical protein
MSSEQAQGNGGSDRAFPESIHWHSGLGVPVNETIWRCDAMRAGVLYNRMWFDTLEEANNFVQKMREAEPDQMFNVEAIKASTIWN